MAGIGNHHDAYVATPLAEKHRWMTGGKGLAATQLAAEGLGAMAPAFAEHERIMRTGLERLGIAWSGEAAGAATATLRAAATWAEQAGQVSGSGKGSVESYGNSFAATARMVPEPKPVPDLSWWDRYGPPHWFDIQTDHDQALQQNQNDDAQAVLALDRHEQATRLAALGFPDQDAPVPLTQPVAATLAGDGGGGTPGGPGSDLGAAPGGGAGTGGHAGATPGGGVPGGPGGGANGPHPTPPPTSPQVVTPSGSPPGPGIGLPPTGSPGGPTTPSAPPMVPLPTNGGGAPTTTGPRMHGSPRRTGLPGSAPPTERGPVTPGEPRSGAGWGGAPAVAPGGRPGGSPAGLMPPMTGGAGAGNRGREHRNNVFIPSDEPFVTPLQDDVTPPVLGLDGGPGDPGGFEDAGARR